MSDSSNSDPIISNFVNEAATSDRFDDALSKDTGVHFLTEQMQELTPNLEGNKEDGKDGTKGRHDMLEYMLRNDGSVICKMCGEVLQSRTHWYRHKYKRHVTQPLNPAPLFQCDQCLIYFKSRKGYIGHIASRHSELLSDASPVLTNAQAEAYVSENPPSTKDAQELKDETDPEMMIPKSSVPTKKIYRGKEQIVNQADWEERRSREDKLVADIIDRVRRECEAKPAQSVSTRRPYSRRTGNNATVMHTLRRTDALT